MENKVIEVIAQAISVDISDINIKTGVGDSLGHTAIIAALESAFDVVFDIEEALDSETVEDMVEIIEEKLS